MLRGHPDLILDGRSGARRAGRRPHRPEPDRPRRARDGAPRRGGRDGLPVACAATAANVSDTLLFGRLFLTAFAVAARIGAVFADKGYDAERDRDLCRAFGAEPGSTSGAGRAGSGLGERRWPVERSNARLLENKRLALRHDRPRLRRPVPAPGRLSLPGCRTPRQGILKTAS